jgi:hypothetical protein
MEVNEEIHLEDFFFITRNPFAVAKGPTDNPNDVEERNISSTSRESNLSTV